MQQLSVADAEAAIIRIEHSDRGIMRLKGRIRNGDLDLS